MQTQPAAFISKAKRKQALLKFGGLHKKAAAESAPPKQKHVLKTLFFVAFVFKTERKPYARNEDYCADDNHYVCHHAYRVVLEKAAERVAVAVSTPKGLVLSKPLIILPTAIRAIMPIIVIPAPLAAIYAPASQP